VAELQWRTHHDPFWGRCVLISNLSFDREKKDYVALYIGCDDPQWGLARRFLKHRHGVCIVPADDNVKSRQFAGVSLDGAVLEVRVDGEVHVRQLLDGALVPIDDANVRPAIAAWLFATGQSLHP
jgi:hypothetical protein